MDDPAASLLSPFLLIPSLHSVLCIPDGPPKDSKDESSDILLSLAQVDHSFDFFFPHSSLRRLICLCLSALHHQRAENNARVLAQKNLEAGKGEEESSAEAFVISDDLLKKHLGGGLSKVFLS